MNITQERMLQFIQGFIAGNGYSPSYEEIRVALSMSTKSLVDYHLDQLESAKRITRVPGRTRTVRLVEQSEAGRDPASSGRLQTRDCLDCL